MASIDELIAFGWDHYTYINQIFGDYRVQDCIAKVFPNKKYEFCAKDDEEMGCHHYLKAVQTGEEVCSIQSGIQNTKVDVNDTLCQSYAIAKYMGAEINKTDTRKAVQDKMMHVYRKILNNREFQTKLKGVLSNPDILWRDWKVSRRRKRRMYIDKKDAKTLLTNMWNVLRTWEKFGFQYYTGNGRGTNTCV
jgi:hypothetical protein